jgi:hypothetical protein
MRLSSSNSIALILTMLIIFIQPSKLLAIEFSIFSDAEKKINFCFNKYNYTAQEEATRRVFNQGYALFDNKNDLQKLLSAIEDFLGDSANKNIKNVEYFYIGDALPQPMCMIGLPAPSKDNCTWILNRRTALYKMWHNNPYLIISSFSNMNDRKKETCLRMPLFKNNKSLKIIAKENLDPKFYGEYYIFSMENKEYLLSVKNLEASNQTSLSITEDQQIIKDLKSAITSMKNN